MRITADTHPNIKLVWHCRLMYAPLCEWVDTTTAQWREIVRITKSGPLLQTKQARRIVFDESTLTIYIDPIADDRYNAKEFYAPKPQKEFT